MSRADYDGQVT